MRTFRIRRTGHRATRRRRLAALVGAGAIALGTAACGGGQDGGAGGLSGSITIDGSSTVFPFAQAAAEMFMAENPGVRITVGQSGTGGGFEKFCAGETDISDASRPIKDEEQKACQDKGVRYEELSVANDGIAVVTNKDLAIDCLTVSELGRLWRPEDPAQTYAEVAPRLPDEEVSLYGPGTDSGTFDFFTEQINGEEGASRTDYQASEDDNVLVQGVTADERALGYFGYSFYEQNADDLNLVAIKDDDETGGCVKPTPENIRSGEYKPLSRQVFMYPSAQALEEPAVRAFMNFILDNQKTIAEAGQMVPLTAEQLREARAKVERLTRSETSTATTTTEGG